MNPTFKKAGKPWLFILGFLGLFGVVSALSPGDQVGIPYQTGFETSQGYSTGTIPTSTAWTVSGSVEVINTGAASGTQCVRFNAGISSARLQLLTQTHVNGNIVFVDFKIKGSAAALSSLPQSFPYETASAIGIVSLSSTEAELYAIDGNGDGSGEWVATGIKLPIASGVATGWSRLTYRLDYTAKTWDLYSDGQLVLTDLGFISNALTTFKRFAIQGDYQKVLYLDDVAINVSNPLFTDADRDGIDDSYETAHGLNTSFNDRYLDHDNDGLDNLMEYSLGAAADNVDSDGDGLSDGMDPDPVVDDVAEASSFPFQENFETRTLGTLSGQASWNVIGGGTALVQGTELFQGTRALKLTGDTSVDRRVNGAGRETVWTDFHLKPVPLGVNDLPPQLEPGSTVGFYVRSDGAVRILNGTTHAWQTAATIANPSSWHRFSIKQNYTSQKWALWIDESLMAENITFATSSDHFKRFEIRNLGGTSTYLDDLQVAATLRGSDTDGDGMPDEWEVENGLAPDNAADASANPDADQWTNRQEYEDGLDPHHYDGVPKHILIYDNDSGMMRALDENLNYVNSFSVPDGKISADPAGGFWLAYANANGKLAFRKYTGLAEYTETVTNLSLQFVTYLKWSAQELLVLYRAGDQNYLVSYDIGTGQLGTGYKLLDENGNTTVMTNDWIFGLVRLKSTGKVWIKGGGQNSAYDLKAANPSLRIGYQEWPQTGYGNGIEMVEFSNSQVAVIDKNWEMNGGHIQILDPEHPSDPTKTYSYVNDMSPTYGGYTTLLRLKDGRFLAGSGYAPNKITEVSSGPVVRHVDTGVGLFTNNIYSNDVGVMVEVSDTFGDVGPAAAVSNLTAQEYDNGDVVLNWTDNSENESGFIIQRSDDGGLTWTTIHTTAANAASYTVTGGSVGTSGTSQFRVGSANGAGSNYGGSSGTAPTLEEEGDKDGDGLSNGEEALLKTDPRDEDSDNDEVIDGSDWGPLTNLITKPRLPATRYAVVDLGEFGSPSVQTGALRINNQSQVIGGGATPFYWTPTLGRQTFAGSPEDINDNGAIVGYNASGFPVRWAAFGEEPARLRLSSDFMPSEEENIYFGEEYNSVYQLKIADSGRVIGNFVGADYPMEFKTDAPSLWWSDIPAISAALQAYGGSELAIELQSLDGAIVYSNHNDSGEGPPTIYYSPSLEALPIALVDCLNFWATGINTDGVIAGIDYDGDYNNWNYSSVLYLKNSGGEHEKYDFQTHNRPPLQANLGRLNNKLQIAAGEYLVQNDQAFLLDDLVDSSQWDHVTASDINEAGLIVGTAIKDENNDGEFDLGTAPSYAGPDKRHAVLLIPIEFVTKGPNGEFLQQSFTYNSVSSPVINVTTSSAQLSSSGNVTLLLAGEVTDDTSDCAPTSSKHVQDISIIGPGVEQTFNLSNSDSPDPQKPWRPYAFRANFSNSFTLSDLQVGNHRIAVQTGQNAGGMAGLAEVSVDIREPGTYSEIKVPMPTSLNLSQIETLNVQYGLNSIQLTETQASSSVFVGTLGNLVVTLDCNAYVGATSTLDSLPVDLNFSLGQKIIRHRLALMETSSSSNLFVSKFASNLDVNALGLQIKLNLPGPFVQGQVDTVDFAYGQNSVITLTETGNNTLIFEGAGSVGEVRVALLGFDELTTQVDTLETEWSIVYAGGWRSNFKTTMSEGTATSRSFANSLRQVSCDVTASSGPGNFFPTIVRFPAEIDIFGSPNMKINIMDHDWSLKKKTYDDGEYWYAVDSNDKPVVFNPSLNAQTDDQTKLVPFGEKLEFLLKEGVQVISKGNLPVVSGLLVKNDDVRDLIENHLVGVELERNKYPVGSDIYYNYIPKDETFSVKEQNKESEIYWRWVRSKKYTYFFGSRNEIKNDVKYRKAIIDLAKNHVTAHFLETIEKANPLFWKEGKLTSGPVNNIAASVSNIFSAADGKEYEMACESMMSCLHLKATLDTIEETAFKEKYTSSEDPRPKRRLTLASTSLKTLIKPSNSITEQYSAQLLTEEVDILPGDWVYIMNKKNSAEDFSSVYAGENLLYIGDNFEENFDPFIRTAKLWGFTYSFGGVEFTIAQWMKLVDGYTARPGDVNPPNDVILTGERKRLRRQ